MYATQPLITIDLLMSFNPLIGSRRQLELELGLGIVRDASIGVGVVIGRVRARVEFVHVVFGLSTREAHDEGGHGHFDVELYHVGYRVELDVYDGVFEEH